MPGLTGDKIGEGAPQRSGRFLGLHWSVYLWVWYPLWAMSVLAWYAVEGVFTLALDPLAGRYFYLHAAEVVEGLALVAVAYGAYRGLGVLSVGTSEGSSRTVVGCLAWVYFIGGYGVGFVLNEIAVRFVLADEPAFLTWVQRVLSFLVR